MNESGIYEIDDTILEVTETTFRKTGLNINYKVFERRLSYNLYTHLVYVHRVCLRQKRNTSLRKTDIN